MEGLEAPVRYFPLRLRTARSEPTHVLPGRFIGLSEDRRLHGPPGGRCFQLDGQRDRYLWEKRRVIDQPGRVPPPLPGCQEPLDHTRRWIAETLQHEYPGRFQAAQLSSLERIARAVQEDLVVMVGRRWGERRVDPADAVAAFVHVCLPSGWAPEAIVGQSFEAIHRPVPSVPGFEDRASPTRAAGPSPRRKLAATMFGPCPSRTPPRVRFVWTVTSGPELDRHRDLGAQNDWPTAACAHLRVERQVVVPLHSPRFDICVFLIRVYVQPVEALTTGQRRELALAVETLPEPLARYKGLLEHRRRITRLVDAPGPG